MSIAIGKIEIETEGLKMLFIILSLFILIQVMIGLYDFSFYRIPNLLLGTLILLYGFYAPLYLDFNTLMHSLAIFAIVLVLSFGLYALKIIGAGDAKYIAVTSLWFGLHKIAPFLLLVSVIGGVLSIFYLVFTDHIARLSDLTWLKIQKAELRYPKLKKIWMGSGTGSEMGKRDNIGSRMIPYGIAIAAGSIIMLMVDPITH